jgi:hypothetical protein
MNWKCELNGLKINGTSFHRGGWMSSDFLFKVLCLSLILDLWEPLEVLLDPEVSRSASLSATLWGVLSSEVLLSVDVSLQLTGL